MCSVSHTSRKSEGWSPGVKEQEIFGGGPVASPGTERGGSEEQNTRSSDRDVREAWWKLIEAVIVPALLTRLIEEEESENEDVA